MKSGTAVEIRQPDLATSLTVGDLVFIHEGEYPGDWWTCEPFTLEQGLTEPCHWRAWIEDLADVGRGRTPLEALIDARRMFTTAIVNQRHQIDSLMVRVQGMQRVLNRLVHLEDPEAHNQDRPTIWDRLV